MYHINDSDNDNIDEKDSIYPRPVSGVSRYLVLEDYRFLENHRYLCTYLFHQWNLEGSSTLQLSNTNCQQPGFLCLFRRS